MEDLSYKLFLSLSETVCEPFIITCLYLVYQSEVREDDEANQSKRVYVHVDSRPTRRRLGGKLRYQDNGPVRRCVVKKGSVRRPPES